MKYLLSLALGLCLITGVRAQDSLSLDLQRHFVTHIFTELNAPEVKMTHFPYLYSLDELDDGGSITSFQIYKYDEISIEGSPVWEGDQKWAIPDTPNFVNYRYSDFQSFRIGSDSWFAVYNAENRETGLNEEVVRIFVKEDPAPEDEVNYPLYVSNDETIYEYMEAIAFFTGNGRYWITGGLQMFPFRTIFAEGAAEAISIREGVSPNEPAAQFFSVKNWNLEFISQDKFIVAQGSFAALFDLTDPENPITLEQKEYTGYSQISIIEEGDNFIYFRGIKDGVDKLMMVNSGTLDLVSEIDLGFQFILPGTDDFEFTASIVRTRPQGFNGNVIEAARDIITFYHFNEDQTDVYQFKQSGDELILEARGLNLIPEEFGYPEDVFFDDRGNVIVSLTLDKGDEFPVGFAIYNLLRNGQVQVSNEEEVTEIEDFELKQNYPNPFNPSTNISFNLKSTSDVRLEVYDLTGRLISTLVDGRRAAGSYTESFNAQNLASGVYIYRLTAGSNVMNKKMILIK